MLKRISEYIWEIPKSYRDDMRVPARVFSSSTLLSEIKKDNTLKQLVNVTTLPGIVGAACVMPDAHEGYGFPIGGVAATAYPDGVISPGGIGYDINCGVRLLVSSLTEKDVLKNKQKIAESLFTSIPAGVGKGGNVKMSKGDIDMLSKRGAAWIIERGYGKQKDLENTESKGCIQDADSQAVSLKAKKRGESQVGTMGAGNHFVEVDTVSAIYDKNIASLFGLRPSQIVVLIHTGSRGFGHQIATDYIRQMMGSLKTYDISLPDRELACAPFSSPEGQAYFHAMACAANFAFANRQAITHLVRKSFSNVFGNNISLPVLYDVAHNIAKIEEHNFFGTKQKVIVHRKGATRAFPPHHSELPTHFQKSGQPVIIPGSMGTASYVLSGLPDAMNLSFGSACHGAGRRMSRTKAKRTIQVHQLKKELKQKGIYLHAGSYHQIAEEAPSAYKDVDEVIDVVTKVRVAKKIAKLRPLVVVKG